MASNTTYNATSLVANSASIHDLKLNSETLTAAGNASTTIPVTLINNGGNGALAIALADGSYNGQLKVFITTSADAHIITPVTEAGAFVTATMTAAVGSNITMIWLNSIGWSVLSRGSGAAQTEAAVSGLPELA